VQSLVACHFLRRSADEWQGRLSEASVNRVALKLAAHCVAGVFDRPPSLRRTSIHWLLAWWLLVANASLSAATFRAGSWSVDVSVAPDKAAIMLGEPTWLSFTVKNLSAENLQILVGGDYGNELGRPSSFNVKTTRSDGKWVSQPDVGITSGGLIGPKDLPAGGSYVFRLFVPHWATFDETGTYTIACERTLQLLRPVGEGADWKKQPTVDVVANARTTLLVQPRDADQMGRLIAELGDAMLRAEGNKPGDEPTIMLSWIDDVRVVPYFRRALALRSYTLKFIAVQVLARFATDEALEGLKTAMQTRAEDFDAIAGEAAPELATKIRVTAAAALSRSKHPRALAFLATLRRDPVEDVRMTVLRALTRLPADEALPLVQEMTRDSSARVSEEAKRYLTALWRRGGAPEQKR
jgi:hypothetical protein